MVRLAMGVIAVRRARATAERERNIVGIQWGLWVGELVVFVMPEVMSFTSH